MGEKLPSEVYSRSLQKTEGGGEAERKKRMEGRERVYETGEMKMNRDEKRGAKCKMYVRRLEGEDIKVNSVWSE